MYLCDQGVNKLYLYHVRVLMYFQVEHNVRRPKASIHILADFSDLGVVARAWTVSYHTCTNAHKVGVGVGQPTSTLKLTTKIFSTKLLFPTEFIIEVFSFEIFSHYVARY